MLGRSELLKLVEEGVVCPMCVETIAASDVKSLSPSQITRGGAEREANTPEEEVISHRPNNYRETSQITRGGAEREANTPEEEV